MPIAVRILVVVPQASRQHKTITCRKRLAVAYVWATTGSLARWLYRCQCQRLAFSGSFVQIVQRYAPHPKKVLSLNLRGSQCCSFASAIPGLLPVKWMLFGGNSYQLPTPSIWLNQNENDQKAARNLRHHHHPCTVNGLRKPNRLSWTFCWWSSAGPDQPKAFCQNPRDLLFRLRCRTFWSNQDAFICSRAFDSW